jgi:3',5'-cyclic AMP phosphodiesterase CpdA
MRSRLIPFALLLAAACSFDVGQFFFHPTVEDRVTENLSGALAVPAAVAVNPDSFSFAVFSDIHTEPGEPALLDTFALDISAHHIDFFCVLGDITDAGTPEEFALAKTSLDRVGIPYYVTCGNHDFYQSAGWQSFKQTFGPSCYSVVIAGRVKLIFMDSADGALGARQFDWLAAELADTSVVKVVGTHYPIFDGTDPIMWRIASTAERYKLEHLLEKYQARAYCAGHVHGWRHTTVGDVDHFTCGTMCPGGLDYGEKKGYLLFTFAHDSLAWTHVEIPATP